MPRLSHRPVLVTGAAGAIGAAICRGILDAGGGVIGCDLQRGEHVEHVFDVTDEEGWREATGRIAAGGDGLAGLVNAAGVFVRGTIAETNGETFARVLAVNLDGTFLGCKHAIAAMKQRDPAAPAASIVNISSRSGQVGIPAAAAYASSKASIRNHTKTVALYCAQQNYRIRCNSIQPASILTPMWDPMLGTGAARDAAIAQFGREIPLGRMGTALDVAYMALYLASDESAYVTGAEFVIDGGLLAGTASTPNR